MTSADIKADMEALEQRIALLEQSAEQSSGTHLAHLHQELGSLRSLLGRQYENYQRALEEERRALWGGGL